MAATRRRRRAVKDNPLDGEQLLLDALYGRPKPLAAVPSPPPEPELVPPPVVVSTPQPAPRPRRPKPEHYKVVSISLYMEDIDRLEQMVLELKRRGHHKANKSQLIRQALAQVDLDRVANEA